MRIVMLGWEYPPHISGGLGTACEGLSKALTRYDLDIIFVVPHFFGGETAPHMTLVDAAGDLAGGPGGPVGKFKTVHGTVPGTTIKRARIPAMLSPYWNPETYKKFASENFSRRALESILLGHPEDVGSNEAEYDSDFAQYGGDIFAEVSRFTAQVVELLANEEFDVIHAHDWMTYPAGVALSRLTGKPLVVHVHSLEYDRSGAAMNEQINHIEGFGLHAANVVVGVSYYTRSVIHQQHNVPLEKIQVVHNGVYDRHVVQSYRKQGGWSSKIVLFLGRITFQKGPDYLVEAAAKVIPHVPDVTFVMAGAGDMLPQCMNRVHELGLDRHFEFPGFLRGQEVEGMFSVADLYVMPSVSEPFGISALEAISFDTPVIISKQSGVSEVLGHALKVDFWDVDRLADLIINALLHEELRNDMVSMAREELKRLRWDAAALRTIDIYNSLV